MSVVKCLHLFVDVVYQVYHNLSQVPYMRAYMRQDIPERFHFKGGKFVSPLMLVADPGWFIAEVL